MKTKQIIIVSACALAVFIAGLAIGYYIPKHHGPRGFHHRHEMMCDKCDCKDDPTKCTCDEDCPCKRKMMKGDRKGPRGDRMGRPDRGPRDGRMGPSEGGFKGPRGPRPEGPMPEVVEDLDNLAMEVDVQVPAEPQDPNNPVLIDPQE